MLLGVDFEFQENRCYFIMLSSIARDGLYALSGAAQILMVSSNRAVATASLWRNVTSHDQRGKIGGKVEVYHGVFSSDQVLKFSSALNVRESYGRGSVHKAITETLEETPDRFRYLNGGITVVSKSIITRERGNSLEISFSQDASIINGTQTQGALRKYHGYNTESEQCSNTVPSVDVDVTVIVTTDEDLMTDITVARNVQNKVKDLSVFGRQGAFNDLNSALKKAGSPFELSTSETDRGTFETGKALQLAFAIMPEDFWELNLPKVKCSRPTIYSSKNKWMKLFGETIAAPKDDKTKELKKFIVEILPAVLDLYENAKHASFWRQRYWQTTGVVKNDDGSVKSVKDGYIFPFVVAHSIFVKQDDHGVWKIELPVGYAPEKIVEAIKEIYDKDADDLKNVQLFGKNALAYMFLIKAAKEML